MRKCAGGGRVTVGDHNDGRAIEMCARHAVDDGSRAGSECRDAGAGRVCDFGLRQRSNRRSRFCGSQDKWQVRARSRIDNVEIPAAAGQAENHPDARRAHAAHNIIGNARHGRSS